MSRIVLVAGTLLAALCWGPSQALSQTIVGLVDFDSDDGGFTVVNTNNPGGPWTHNVSLGSWSCFDLDGCGAAAYRGSRLNSPILTVLQAGPQSVVFLHRYDFEDDGSTRWDGGQVRVSINGGDYVTVTNFTQNGYTGTIGGASVPNNEIRGQMAFTGTSPGYASQSFIVSEFVTGSLNVDDTISVQFLGAWDDCVQGAVPNWEINSVQFVPALEDRRFAPVILDPTQPADVSVNQGESAVLEVFFSGIPIPRIQWFRNNFPRIGQTNSTYVIGFATPGVDDGGYYATATNTEGSTNSRVATVTVIPDTQAPLFVSGAVLDANSVRLTFNEPMTNHIDYFSISFFEKGGAGEFLGVQSATLQGLNLLTGVGGTTWIITPISPLSLDVPYQVFIGIGAVRDQFGNDFLTDDPPGTAGQIADLDLELTEMIVPFNATWRYDDTAPARELITNAVPFFSPSYVEDAAWKSGAGPFSNPGEALPTGAPAANTVILGTSAGGPTTIYFRHQFFVADAAKVTDFRMVRAFFDDGVVLYLNGTEVYRNNVPAGQNSTTTTLGVNHEGNQWEGPVVIHAANLVSGNNLLAVELHQQSATGSSDAVWGAEFSVTTVGIVGDICPTIETQPAQPPALTEGDALVLSVVASGTPPLLFQWNTNGSPVAGATQPVYSINPLGLSDAGTYTVTITGVAGCTGGSGNQVVTSDPVTVTVNADTVRPALVDATVGLDPTQLLLAFSEPIAETTGTNVANYTVSFRTGGGALTIESATLQGNGSSILLRTSPRSGGNYRLTVRDLRDRSTAGNLIDPNPTLRDLPSAVAVVALGATWRYEDTSPALELITNALPFFNLSFDDSAWKTGPAPFGTEPTSLPPGVAILTPVLNTGAGGPIVSYYRIRFNVENLANVDGAFLANLLFDDGFVAYVNGVEVARQGVAANQNATTTAASHEASSFEGPFEIPRARLVQGENLLAVELHDNSAASSDTVWACEVALLLRDITVVPVAIVTQPVGASLNEGDTLILTVEATGTQPLYQWTLNEADIAGANSATYTVASVTEAHAGQYAVRVSNSANSATSDTVTVTVVVDNLSPTVVDAVLAEDSLGIVRLTLSEAITTATATNAAHYTLAPSGGGTALVISNAVQMSATEVWLETEPRASAFDPYALTVRDLRDVSQAGNVLAPNPTVVDPVPTEILLVDYGTIGSWTYLDTAEADLDPAWKSAGYDTTAWLTGSPLFYGKRGTPGVLDIPSGTTLNLSNAAVTAQLPAYYFRGNINLGAGDLAQGPLRLQYILDDGAVFYVNGVEVLRVGMPSGTISRTTLANRTQGNDQLWEAPALIPAGAFVMGNNLVAAEVHQVNLISSDVAFALRLFGTGQATAPLVVSGSVMGGNFILTWADPGFPVYVQESTNLIDWTTQAGGPHTSPHNAGAATGAKFLKLSDTP